jgi:hypothetical protein
LPFISTQLLILFIYQIHFTFSCSCWSCGVFLRNGRGNVLTEMFCRNSKQKE